MTLEEAVNMAAAMLPDGYQINLCVERGAGWIDLYDEDGDQINFDSSPDNNLAEQIEDAVTEARSLRNL